MPDYLTADFFMQLFIIWNFAHPSRHWLKPISVLVAFCSCLTSTDKDLSANYSCGSPVYSSAYSFHADSWWNISECTSIRISGHESTGYAYLTSGNNCEAGRVLPERFVHLSRYYLLYIFISLLCSILSMFTTCIAKSGSTLRIIQIYINVDTSFRLYSIYHTVRMHINCVL